MQLHPRTKYIVLDNGDAPTRILFEEEGYMEHQSAYVDCFDVEGKLLQSLKLEGDHYTSNF